MSPYTPFRTRRGIHHLLPVRMLWAIWLFFSKSTWGMKIVLVGLVSLFSWLFFPWIRIGDIDALWPFSLLCGGVGWIISIIVIGLLIHLFSYDMTQKVQKIWHINLDPRDLYIRAGGLVILMTLIVSLCLTGAARTINGDISMQIEVSGLVLTLVGAILLCLGGLAVRRQEDSKAYKHVFVQGIENEDSDSYKKILWGTEEGNMKLPI